MNRINRHSLMKAPFGRLCVTGLVTLGLMIVPARATEADTFVVNSIEDLPDFSAGNGKCATSILFPKCTLRAAVMEANALSGAPHTIVIPSGTYTLTRVSPPGEEHLQNFGPLRIFTSMKLEASNGVAVVRGDAGWPHRIFTINLNVTVSMTGLDIANGHAQDGLSGGAVRIAGFGSVVTLTDVTVRNSTVQNANGGGISNNGALTLDRCVIRNNGAAGVGGGLETFGATVIKESVIRENSAEFGGGIASFGTLTISRTTLVQNTADSKGGGIFNGNGTATITNSALTSNSSNGDGGGIWNEGPSGSLTVDSATLTGNVVLAKGGAIGSGGTAVLKNATLSGNGAFGAGGGLYSSKGATMNNTTIASNSAGTGGGVMNDAGSLAVANSILANNSATTGPDCSGAFSSQGFNLIQITSACTISGVTLTNITGQDPLLGPLQQNGGFATTRALGAGSPAIDRGAPSTPLVTQCEADDERQVPRPQDGDFNGEARCDMGAFEVAKVGAFEVAPDGASVVVGDLTLFTYRWTAPGVWRDLDTLQLRFVGTDGVALTIIWEESTNTFRLIDGSSDGLGPTGAPGARGHLEAKLARLILEATSVQGSGPTGHDVTLTLGIVFKTQAAPENQPYRIEAAATDDFGDQQPFAAAGTVVVQTKKPAI